MAAVRENYALFRRIGVNVLAGSVDSEEDTQRIITEHGLSFPVAYGMALDQAATLGAFTGERLGNTYIQPTEFVLRPGGEVAASMYSSTQLGRMNPREVLQFLKSRMGG